MKSILTVICVLSVFTQVVLVQQFLLHGRNAGIHDFGMEGHESQFFQNYGIVDSIMRIGSPREGAMAVHQNGRP